MTVRNDNALEPFNGDIGITLDREWGTHVWFVVPDGNIKSV